MSTERQESSFVISLRIRHPSVDPAEISRELGWQPKIEQKMGEPRATPRGTPLSGQNRESFWLAQVSTESSESLAAAIRRTNDRLRHARNFLEHLSDSGGRIEFFIGWFVDGSTGEEFDWMLLRLREVDPPI